MTKSQILGSQTAKGGFENEGEILPNIPNPRDNRRMFIDEFTDKERHELFNYLNKNRIMIISDVLRGRG